MATTLLEAILVVVPWSVLADSADGCAELAGMAPFAIMHLMAKTVSSRQHKMIGIAAMSMTCHRLSMRVA